MTDYGSTLQYSFVEGYVDPHGDDHQGASFETDVAASYTSGCFAGDSNLVVPQNGAYWTDHEAFQCLNPSQGSLPFLPLPETPVWVDFPPAASVSISLDSLQNETYPIFGPLHPLPQPEHVPQSDPIFAAGGPQHPSSARGFDGMSFVSTGMRYPLESIHEANLGPNFPFDVEVGCRPSHNESFHQPARDIIASTAISLIPPHPSSADGMDFVDSVTQHSVCPTNTASGPIYVMERSSDDPGSKWSDLKVDLRQAAVANRPAQYTNRCLVLTSGTVAVNIYFGSINLKTRRNVVTEFKATLASLHEDNEKWSKVIPTGAPGRDFPQKIKKFLELYNINDIERLISPGFLTDLSSKAKLLLKTFHAREARHLVPTYRGKPWAEVYKNKQAMNFMRERFVIVELAYALKKKWNFPYVMLLPQSELVTW